MKGKGSRLSIHSSASLVMLQVKVLLGDEDVTSRFMHKHHLVTGGGVAGLQPVYYEVTMTNDALDVDYSYHEKTLSCLASLAPDDIPSTLNSTLAQMSADLNITLLCECTGYFISPQVLHFVFSSFFFPVI